MPIASCGSFDVLDQYTLDSTVILFFDAAGHLTRFIERGADTAALTETSLLQAVDVPGTGARTR